MLAAIGYREQHKAGVLPFDPWVLTCAISLVLIGFIMISSASLDVALENNGTPYYYLVRQAIFITLGLIIGGCVWRIPISFWETRGPFLMIGAMLLLIVVLIPGIGREVNGSRRWIPLGPINLQASEVAKFCMVLYMGGYLVRRVDQVRNTWIGIAKPALPLGVFVGLMLMEPDFGAAVVLMGTVMVMIFLGGMRFTQFILILLGAVALLGALVGMQSYRLERLQTYLNPWADPYGAGYQLTQAQIAFGRGEWFGTGLGNSVQKLFYLPEAHTDFVFSVLAEELGFIGVLCLIGLYGVLVWRLYRIGRRAEKMKAFFMAYVTYGFTTIFAGQALINIGVNVGALPTKGLTLPLVSYGGSSLLVSCAMLAVVLRIDLELKKRVQAEAGGGKRARRAKTKKEPEDG